MTVQTPARPNKAARKVLVRLKILMSVIVVPSVYCHVFFTANFALPEDEADSVVPMFTETKFVELERTKALEVVQLYNKVSKEKGYGKKHEERKTKKFRGSTRGTFKPRGQPTTARGNFNP